MNVTDLLAALLLLAALTANALSFSRSRSDSTSSESTFPYPFDPTPPSLFPSPSSYGRLNYSIMLYQAMQDITHNDIRSLLTFSQALTERYHRPAQLLRQILNNNVNRTVIERIESDWILLQNAWFSNGTQLNSGRYWSFPWSNQIPYLIHFSKIISNNFFNYIKNTTDLNSNSCSCYAPLNDGPNYTNNFLDGLSCQITIVNYAGNSTQIANIWKILRYTPLYIQRLGINEYNSWYYSVDLEDLNQMLTTAINIEQANDIIIILKFLWATITANYFPGIADMSGPQSRTYTFVCGGAMNDDNANVATSQFSGDSFLNAYQLPYTPYGGTGNVFAFQGPPPYALYLSQMQHHLRDPTYRIDYRRYEPVDEIKMFILEMPYRIIHQRGVYVGMKGPTQNTPNDLYHYITPSFTIGCSATGSGNEDITVVTKVSANYYRHLSTQPHPTNFLTLPAIRVQTYNNLIPYGSPRIYGANGTVTHVVDRLHPSNFHRCTQQLGLQLITVAPTFTVIDHDTTFDLAEKEARASDLSTYITFPLEADYLFIDDQRLPITADTHLPLSVEANHIFTVVQGNASISHRILFTSFSAQSGVGNSNTWPGLGGGPIRSMKASDSVYYNCDDMNECRYRIERQRADVVAVTPMYSLMWHVDHASANNRMGLLTLHHAPPYDDAEFNATVHNNSNAYEFRAVIAVLAEELSSEYNVNEVFASQNKLRAANFSHSYDAHSSLWKTQLLFVDPDDPATIAHPVLMTQQRTWPFARIGADQYTQAETDLIREVNGRTMGFPLTEAAQTMIVWNVTESAYRAHSYFTTNADLTIPFIAPFNVTLPTSPIPDDLKCMAPQCTRDI